MFDEMIAAIRENTVKMVIAAPKRIVEIQKRNAELERKRQEIAKQAAAAHQVVLPGQMPPAPTQNPINVVIKREQVAQPTSTSADGTDTRNKTVRKTAKDRVGRNDPCPCGSGKKYKKCCGADE